MAHIAKLPAARRALAEFLPIAYEQFSHETMQSAIRLNQGLHLWEAEPTDALAVEIAAENDTFQNMADTEEKDNPLYWNVVAAMDEFLGIEQEG